MASTYTTLGIEKMATGENAGTWGTKTNTNLDIVNTAISGYVEQAVTSGGTLALSITDGAATSTAQNAVIKLTGTITGNSIVTVPDSVEKVYIVTNGTSGAYTVQFKTASGTGVTFGVSEKTTKLLYSDGTNIVDAGFSGALDIEGRELVLDADGDTSITADTDDQIDIRIAGADDFQFTANTFTAQSGSTIAAQALTATTVTASGIVKTDDTTEATSTTDGSLQTDGGLSVAKDAVIGDDLKLLSDSAVLSFGADSDVSLTHVADTALLLNAAMRLQFRDSGLYIGSNADGDLDVVSDGTAVDSINLESAGGITLDAGTAGSGIIYEDDGTEMARIHNSSSNVILETKVSDADFSIKGNDGGSTITPLTFDMSDAGKATFSGNVIVSGDLTVSGDDITMGTNTAGNLLVADGTNFNSIAAGSLSEISTVANDDVFIAVDTSGGGLKKIARSTIVAGLATSGAISNVVEDTSPQLGANLDTNSHNILIDDAHFIADENGNEQIIFQTTSSAVNQFDVTNAATSGAPKLSATGGDSNIDLEIEAKGTGHVTVKGNTNPGTIQFNCENNSHGQQIKGAAHSVGSSAVVTIPDITGEMIVGKIEGTNFTDSLLLGHATTGTLDAAEDNTGVGINALESLTSGDKNTALGHQAGKAITTASQNVYLGNLAGYQNTSSNFNIGIGDSALAGSDGSTASNVAIGALALNVASGANFNIAIGRDAGREVTTGDNNIFIGYNSGANDSTAGITTGSGNVIIGQVDPDSRTNNRQLKITGNDGSSSTTWISGDSSGIVTFADDIKIKDGGTIGSASDADAITIAANGVVTFSQNPVFPDGGVDLIDIDIDGGTDIGADLTTSDLIIVDDGAGGTNRKAALSRLTTFMTAQGFSTDDPTALAIALG
jgi:hypothetical protein